MTMNMSVGDLFDMIGDNQGFGEGTLIQSAKAKKQERYRALARGINVQSYSNFGLMEECERKFAKVKAATAVRYDNGKVAGAENNIHFAYGRAFESGVQATLMGKSAQQIFWEMFLAWDMPLDATDDKGKTFTECVMAIDKFQLIAPDIFGEWELATFNGKSAVELAFCFDLENGYIFVGHVDIVLRNKSSGQFKVIELKTTGGLLHEAKYGNSPQATGYSIVVDEIAKQYPTLNADLAAAYSVLYLVYQSKDAAFTAFEFTKSRSERAGWLNSLMLDYNRIHMYRDANFFPKRGNSCMKFNRPCHLYGVCDLNIDFTEQHVVVPMSELETYEFDFRFKLSDIIKTQKELI